MNRAPAAFWLARAGVVAHLTFGAIFIFAGFVALRGPFTDTGCEVDCFDRLFFTAFGGITAAVLNFIVASFLLVRSRWTWSTALGFDAAMAGLLVAFRSSSPTNSIALAVAYLALIGLLVAGRRWYFSSV